MSWLTGKVSVGRAELQAMAGQLAAMDRSQAVIEFSLDGKILNANANFLNTLGYTLDEIKGKHHSMFVDPAERSSPEYRAFWDKLGRGEFDAAKYKRIAKGGREIWIQASYNPIMDESGKPFKVVKFATDITEQENGAREALFKSAAFGQSSVAMMMVDRDFKVTYVNDSTKKLLNANAAAFRTFWPNFDPDKIIGACIDMFHKNPAHQRQLLSDPSRLPYRTDISIGDLKFSLNVGAIFDARRNYVGNTLEWENVTDTRSNAGMLAALRRSQAVIEFTLEGKVTDANDNFLRALGYSLNEIRGQHHSMFVDPTERATPDYRAFWEKLGRGEFDSGQYKRIAKGGREIWIQASYNPILDGNGKPFKVVKFATDITGDKEMEAEIGTLVHKAVAGDFSHRISLTGKSGSLLKVAELMNSLSANISKVISDIKVAARDVSEASAEISASTTDLSQRTEEQAASLEETSASMEEISATVKKNAENAAQANQSAAATREVAGRGGEVVSKAIEAMARIEQSSLKISDIIGVIDEIARQTNLLALNAAVEAARAGEAGRGFAVVASEVRSLAQRSSQAAKDIKDLITNSNSQVKEGVDLVNRAGKALSEIVDSIKSVAEVISEITDASVQQSSGIEQINVALTKMDEVTQQNSALVEENAATAKTLEEQAGAMNELVAAFKVDDQAQASAPRRAEPRPSISSQKHHAPGSGPRAASAESGRKAPLQRAGGGPARRMQAALATAVKEDADWKEF
jgi:methyl-accepting chemotaxis protein